MNSKLDLDTEVFIEEYASVNGVNIHFVEGGNGPLLLLWHGFLATWYCWHKVMPELARKYTVIAPDMRGFGDSAKPEQGYDAATLMEDFRALIRKRHAGQQVTIMAHDMGAPPAFLYAATYPNEVVALIYFENPVLTLKNMHQLHQFTPQGTKKGGLWWWSFALATDLPQRLILGHEREFLSWFYETATHDQGKSIGETALTEYLRTFTGITGILGAFGMYRDVFSSIEQTEQYEEISNKIDTPVLALGGELALGKLVQPMLEGVANNVKGKVLSDCGHFIQEERPDELLILFKDFMDELND